MNSFQSSSVWSLLCDFSVVTPLICTTNQCNSGTSREDYRDVIKSAEVEECCLLSPAREGALYVVKTEWVAISLKAVLQLWSAQTEGTVICQGLFKKGLDES